MEWWIGGGEELRGGGNGDLGEGKRGKRRGGDKKR